MFQKDHTAERTDGTTAKDVPLRKSDRRQLCQRAKAYFHSSGGNVVATAAAATAEAAAKTNNDDDDDDEDAPSSSTFVVLDATLDAIFLRGASIMSRSLPASNFPNLSKISDSVHTATGAATTNRTHHQHLVLYHKGSAATDAGGAGAATTSQNEDPWPYSSTHHHNQFVWMALEDKKSGQVLAETPTVALWAVVFSHVEDVSSRFVVTIPSDASKYLCRGADLMRAGMRSVPQIAQNVTVGAAAAAAANGRRSVTTTKIKNKKKNEHQKLPSMVAICVQGNPQPFAVGRSLLTDTDETNVGVGAKGVGVEIWNCYGDDLWRLTCPGKQELLQMEKNDQVQRRRNEHGKVKRFVLNASGEATELKPTANERAFPYDNGHFGNAGFLEGKQVVPIIEIQREDGKSVEEEDSDDEDDDEDVEVEATGDNLVDVDDKKKESDANDENDTIENDNQRVSDENDSDGVYEEELSPDDILDHAVCQALVNLSNKDLPMLVSTFYSQHVLSNRPAGTTIELKKTSWKKFGNYVKEKINEGLIHVGPDPSKKNNNDPLAMLLSFERRHANLRGFSKQSDENGGAGTTGRPSKIVLVNLYVIPSHWTALLRLKQEDCMAATATSEERRGTGMLTMPEARAILDGYIQREGLDSKSSNRKGHIDLDGPLTDAFYNNSKKNQESGGGDYPTQISRKELAKQFTAKLLPAYALVVMPGSHIIQLSKGAPPKIEIDVSRRQSKKFVTRVRGLERYQIDPVYFSKDVSKRLAIPVSIDSDPASSGRAALRQKNDVELVFGGNAVDELEAILTGDEALSCHGGVKDSDYSIPKSVLDVTLRKGVPARKKIGGSGPKKK